MQTVPHNTPPRSPYSAHAHVHSAAAVTAAATAETASPAAPASQARVSARGSRGCMDSRARGRRMVVETAPAAVPVAAGADAGQLAPH